MIYHGELAGVWLWHPCKYQRKQFFHKHIGEANAKSKFQC